MLDYYIYFMKIQHVFFDLDHTLWDFEKNSALTFQEILPAAEVQVPIDSFLKNIYSNQF